MSGTYSGVNHRWRCWSNLTNWGRCKLASIWQMTYSKVFCKRLVKKLTENKRQNSITNGDKRFAPIGWVQAQNQPVRQFANNSYDPESLLLRHPFRNFDGEAVEVSERMNYIIPPFSGHVITILSMLRLKLIHISKTYWATQQTNAYPQSFLSVGLLQYPDFTAVLSSY